MQCSIRRTADDPGCGERVGLHRSSSKLPLRCSGLIVEERNKPKEQESRKDTSKVRYNEKERSE